MSNHIHYIKEAIKDLIHSDKIPAFQRMKKEDRDDIIRKLKKQRISIRNSARITGLSKSIIERA